MLQNRASEVPVATYNITEAGQSLFRLMDEAIGGHEVLIEKPGGPLVRLVPLKPTRFEGRRKFGDNFLGITYIAPDFFDDLPLDLFEALRDDPE